MSRTDFTPNLNLPYLLPNQAQKHVTVNDSLGTLDALLMARVEAIGTSRPPGKRKPGQSWIVGPGPSDAWQKQAGKLAIWRDNAWIFHTPQAGWHLWDKADHTLKIFDGTSWVAVGNTQNLDFIGLATRADKNNPFSLRLNNALMTARTTDDQGNGDLRFSLNKQEQGNVGSIIFQTGWTGHAELGLVGNNDFKIRIAGSDNKWHDALSIDTKSGHLSIGTPQSKTGAATIVHHGLHVRSQKNWATVSGAGSIDLYRAPSANVHVRSRSPGSALCFGATKRNGKGHNTSLVISAERETASFAYSIHPHQSGKTDLGHGNRVWRDLYVKNAPVTTSDRREKTAIKTLEGGPALIAHLRPVSYRHKTGTRQHFGFIAQEVKQALDTINAGNVGLWCLSDPHDSDSSQALRQEELIAVLVAGLQHLQSRLDTVETELKQSSLPDETDQSGARND